MVGMMWCMWNKDKHKNEEGNLFFKRWRENLEAKHFFVVYKWHKEHKKMILFGLTSWLAISCWKDRRDKTVLSTFVLLFLSGQHPTSQLQIYEK